MGFLISNENYQNKYEGVFIYVPKQTLKWGDFLGSIEIGNYKQFAVQGYCLS